MSNTSRGLPLTRSRVEQIFPILTPAQINRIAVHGHKRAIQPSEVLVEQGEITGWTVCAGLSRTCRFSYHSL
jgi:hypothetical protein